MTQIERVDFITEGRKIPLRKIREDLLEKHSQYLRKNKENHYLEMSSTQVMERLKELGELEESKSLDEAAMKKKLANLEQTRNLMVWLDNSTVANHGHLACLITCLYDPAVFYTPEEYKEMTGKSVDIQREIEKPEVHFIARCSSADQEQLTYAETRVECVQELKNPSKIDDVEYKDKLRFSHGDSPARAHEAGQQKGGNYFCSTCEVHCDMTDDLAHVLNCKVQTLEARQSAIISGKIALKNSKKQKSKPLGNLTKQELEQELASRQIFKEGNKAELQNLLNKEMRGKQRVPALLFHNPQQKLSTLGLSEYEILPCEPLHDVGHHIENVFTELPHHLDDSESKAMVESLELCLGSKDKKRTADYRSTLIKTAGHFSQQNILSEKPTAIINTLIEMQRILYAAESLRCPSLILRYYNQSWLHSILLKELIQKPKKLTRRKLFGVYFHNLSAHAGMMLRLISGQASNAEQQERIFNHIKRITGSTSNYHPEQIIPNLLVRLQAENEMHLHANDASQQQAEITKLAEVLPPNTNTSIPLRLIKNHSRDWQAHLQCISDFLVEGEGVWWERNEDKIVFHDITKSPNTNNHGPQIHHFRSSSLPKEEIYLQKCWQKCLDEEITIPAEIIRVDKDDGVSVRHTKFISNGNEAEDSLPTKQDQGITTPAGIVQPDENDDRINDSNTTLSGNEAEDTTTPDNLPSPKNIIDIQLADEEIITLTEEPRNLQVEVTGHEESSASDHLVTSKQTSSESIYPLVTCMAKSAAIVLGNVPEVQKVDRKRVLLKQILKADQGHYNHISKQEAINQYEDSLILIKSKVLAEHTKVKKQFAE